MNILGIIMLIIQVLAAILLVFVIAIQTTKSEQGGAGMGWGTIGGQASSSVHKFGFEAQITRVTTWLAVIFFVTSFLTALIYAHLK